MSGENVPSLPGQGQVASVFLPPPPLQVFPGVLRHLPPTPLPQTHLDEMKLQTPPHQLLINLQELLQQNQERKHLFWGASFPSLPVMCGLFIPRGSPFPDNVPVLDNALYSRVV